MSDSVKGKGFDQCADCVNAEYDPFQCKKCKEGSRFEPFNSTDCEDEPDDDADTSGYKTVKTFFSKKDL
ncbi:hypothetical protein QN372_00380 [Undibacterium sp. RTI2.1]|uniref:hypothetical protein n=1 Tax=unclassified Undibacterium TaxID=2630295 RepID=UPI002AB48D71|nr:MULTISPECIES: hypothetical protein [unclassified Undibacterium]MDY7537595.1 hypothetical protein [Undibacterium sp. 5I1]MEB0029195.1 hypothetical protein [Undibacterium sp. RTI2.1]MEB0115503.1 hypothetical protein [Undibacterium sp. RTI2.2]MEB0230139.1 hypothetical protein [Undibacterium sp. 10I3]MEB0256331.1 hypothetical protein [Undibacterium sp. 5I1]